MATIRRVPIKSHSDGDPTHRPKSDAWKLVDPPTIYLEKLAGLWLQARGERLLPGASYRLDRLPHGYALYARPRPSNSSTTDKHLYGAPSHKFFDSPNRFAPHFLHLMRTGGNLGCPCTICSAVSGRPLAIRAAGTTETKSQSTKELLARVNENAPIQKSQDPAWKRYPSVSNTLRAGFQQLQRNATYDERYEEATSMDWRAESTVLGAFDTIANHPAYLPRVGELVLFVSSIADHVEICLENSSKEFKLFDTKANIFIGRPPWKAGVVAQVGTEDTTTNLEDVLKAPEKDESITLSGFRVEPLPKPGSADKRLSKRFEYVPLNYLRPFGFYQEFLEGENDDNLHSTVNHALTVMASWSLVGRYRLQGKWPRASLLSNGFYLGSELITIGDAVRIRTAQAPAEVLEVLHVTNIKLEFTNLGTSFPSEDVSKASTPSTLAIYGKLYTLTTSCADDTYRKALNKNEYSDLPRGMSGYTWYRRHPQSKSTRVTLGMVIGRLFEAEAMLLWFPPSQDASVQQPSLSYGQDGILRAREYSRRQDKRILTGKCFFWGESRGECLDIHEMNGVALSSHDNSRTVEQLEDWTEAGRVLASTSKHKKVKGKARGAAVSFQKTGSQLMTGMDDSNSEHEQSATTEAATKISKQQLPSLSRFGYKESSIKPAKDDVITNGENDATKMLSTRPSAHVSHQRDSGSNGSEGNSNERGGGSNESDELALR